MTGIPAIPRGGLFVLIAAPLTCFAALSASPHPAAAQSTRKVVEMDLATLEAKGALPFDEDFVVKIPWMEGTDSLKLRIAEARLGPDRQPAEGDVPQGDTVLTRKPGQGVVAVVVHNLEPRTRYHFKAEYFRKVAEGFAKASTVDTIAYSGYTDAPPGRHIDSDIGLILNSHRTGYRGFTSSVHIFAVPINKAADVQPEEILKQFSVFVGLAVAKLESDVPVENQFSAGNLLVGIGWRRLPWVSQWTPLRDMRLNAGVMFYKQNDPNPLIDNKIDKRDVFVSLSLDLEYKALLGPVLGAFGIS